MRVIIHSGHLSVDNGAVFPLTQFTDLAKLLQVEPDWGDHYGFDSLDIAPTDWPLVQELLDEAKMLYKVQGQHEQWQNVHTEAVRQRLAYLCH